MSFRIMKNSLNKRSFNGLIIYNIIKSIDKYKIKE